LSHAYKEYLQLVLFGDGATMKKRPLLIILSLSAHHPAAVLETVDFSSNVQDGGKKDTRYIASLFCL
jgi:hypothetical protein